MLEVSAARIDAFFAKNFKEEQREPDTISCS
jgi:hypothetical protein